MIKKKSNFFMWLFDFEKNYLPPEYNQDSLHFRIIATVHVEAEWDREDQVGETVRLDKLHQ